MSKKKEIERLSVAIERLSSPKPIYRLSANMVPETYARIVYAQSIVRGLSLWDAEERARREASEIYPTDEK